MSAVLDCYITDYFSFLAWQYDTWRFISKPFNGTKLLVSGWNVDIQYGSSINTSFLFPAAGSMGKFCLLM